MDAERKSNLSSQSPSTVIALPLQLRPLCPGYSSVVEVHDSKLYADLVKNEYVGVFLSKDENYSSEVKGVGLLNQLYDIGSLARISSIQDSKLIFLIALTRIRITEMVSEDPLTVKFEHLKDKPYDKEDDAIKATFLEVSSLLKEQQLGDSSYSYLADYGSMIPCERLHQSQQVIEELDVHKRMQLTLELARTELPRYSYFPSDQKPVLYEQTPVGVAMALGLTITGGETNYIVTTLVEEGEGVGYLKVTGQADERAQGSAYTAHIVAQEMMCKKQPNNTFFANSVLRLDLPKGKGTSAGCTITTSMLSLAMNKPVRINLAMTGIITLSGKILGVGSVKEKTIAARKSQVKTIIFPEANRGVYNELDENLKEGIDAHFVDEYEEIFKIAFGYDEENQVEVKAEENESKLMSYVGKYEHTEAGVAMCLAKTSIGGLAWYIKTTLECEEEGEGCLNIMSRLDEGMAKSVCNAYGLAEKILLEKQPNNTFFADAVLNIYLPACSIIKFTSAGCAILTSFLSLAMKIPVRKDLAVIGTVDTLTGNILGTGSVKEMTIGARRSQVKTIIFPEANRRDFDELEEKLKEGIIVHFVDNYDQIFKMVFH